MKNVVLILSIIFLSSKAQAEYRVYQYYVKTKIENLTSTPSDYQIITSTLNPNAYFAYNGGRAQIELHLLRSWMCMGDTSKKEVCTFNESLGN